MTLQDMLAGFRTCTKRRDRKFVITLLYLLYFTPLACAEPPYLFHLVATAPPSLSHPVSPASPYPLLLTQRILPLLLSQSRRPFIRNSLLFRSPLKSNQNILIDNT